MTYDDEVIKEFFRSKVMMLEGGVPAVDASGVPARKINLEKGLESGKLVRIVGPQQVMKRQDADVAARKTEAFGTTGGGFDAICRNYQGQA
jgi:hypothetical protein